MANFTFDVEKNGDVIAINGKTELNLSETIMFANSILNDIFADPNSPNLYLKDFIIKKNVIQYYTDFEFPEDINECFDIVYNSKLHKKIIDNFNFDDKQFELIMLGIEQQIKLETQKAANRTSLDGLFEAITEVIKKVDDKIDISKIGSLLTKLNNVEKIDEKILAEAVISLQKPVRKSKKKADG